MKVTATAIPEVCCIDPPVFHDHRGFFMETWHAHKFRELGLDLRFVQDNQSRSVCGTLRGLHYQMRRPQGKLVRVVAGEVFDVAVDLRRSSPTFGRSVGMMLRAEEQRQLWIPPGFAHGFYVVSPFADVIYKCTELYAPDDDRTLRWDDPVLAIEWPLLERRPPILSGKDAAAPALREAETFA